MTLLTSPTNTLVACILAVDVTRNYVNRNFNCITFVVCVCCVVSCVSWKMKYNVHT
jgi:hypothetical protein